MSNGGLPGRSGWCGGAREGVLRSGRLLRGRRGYPCASSTVEWRLTEVGNSPEGVSRSGPLTLRPQGAKGWELKGVRLTPRGEPGSVRGSPEGLAVVTRGETVTATKQQKNSPFGQLHSRWWVFRRSKSTRGHPRVGPSTPGWLEAVREVMLGIWPAGSLDFWWCRK